MSGALEPVTGVLEPVTGGATPALPGAPPAPGTGSSSGTPVTPTPASATPLLDLSARSAIPPTGSGHPCAAYAEPFFSPV